MRLLWISNNPQLSAVGQSRVTREILQRLHDYKVEVHATGIPPGVQGPHAVPYPVHAWGAERHAYPKSLIQRLHPDVIVCSHDCWNFYWLEQCRKDFPGIKLVGYYTFDGGPIHGSWVQTMMPLDLLVTPTQFGKDQVYQRYPERHVAVIPYGIDHSRFRMDLSKVDKKKTTDVSAKQPDHVQLNDKCIFTYVGMNQGRKNVPCILDAFAYANMEKSRLLMVAHVGVQQIGGWQGMADHDLIDLMGMYDHRERITIATDPMDEASLVSLYQCADYFVLPSQGEAPGLPVIEAMACGCIPIVSDYAGAAEVASGYLVPAVMFRGQFNVNRAIVDAKVLARTMVTAYEAWESGQNEPHIQACLQTAKKYDWGLTAFLWMQHLNGLMEGKTLVDTSITRCL